MTNNDTSITIFDGGTGREIERCGGPFRQPEWSALALYEDPSVVRHVHESFLEAGATAITTNTYAIVPFHIGTERYEKDGRRLLQLAVTLARQARDSYNDKERIRKKKRIQILGSIPPMCGSYEPESFQEQISGPILNEFLNVFCGSGGGGGGDKGEGEGGDKGEDDFSTNVDVLLLETVGSLREARYYLSEIQQYWKDHSKTKGRQSLPSLPVWLSFCVKSEYGQDQEPTLLTGEQISDSIEALLKEGLLDNVEVLMVNCCDVRLVKESIRKIRSTLRKNNKHDQIRIGTYPNAFSIPPPDAANHTLRQVDYNISPHVMKCQTTEWIQEGATVIGGCCGVNPDHIRAMAGLALVVCQPVNKPQIREE